MSIHTYDFHQGEPNPGAAGTPGTALAESAARHWDALHTAAGAVAGLAHLPPEDTPCGAANFASLLAAAPPWKAELAKSALDDIAAFMQSGLTALLAVHAENREPSAAAHALWNEFVHARDAVLKILPRQ